VTSPLQQVTARRLSCAFGLSAVITCALTTIARAEVHVEGTATAVRVTTGQDNIADVLSALAGPFNVTYRTAIPLDVAARSNYAGSFAQVIARLLDGYNYVIKREQKSTEIVVFGKYGEVAIPPPAPTPPVVKSVISQWR
jgi:hypothetical protein